MRGSGFGYCTCFSLWRAGCALTGPRKRWRLGAGKARRACPGLDPGVGARDRAQFAASTWRCCQRTPVARPRSRRTAVRRPPLWGGLLLTPGSCPSPFGPAAPFALLLQRSGYFLLATQEKVTRSPKASESLGLDAHISRRAAMHEAKPEPSHWVPTGRSPACPELVEGQGRRCGIPKRAGKHRA